MIEQTEISDYEHLDRDYIHANPVEDEIVDEPEYYWFSSARNYTGKVGLLKIDLL